MARRLKKDDLVVVISGSHKKSRGRILRIDWERGAAIVQGVNVIKRHQGPTPRNPQGGIIEREAPIHVSKLMLVDEKSDAPTRVRYQTNEDGRKVRVSVKSGTVIDS